MPTARLFQKISLRENEMLSLTLDAAHYLGTVRRLREGDKISIFNGEGGEYSAEILAIKKDKLSVKIHSFQSVNHESPLSIHLIQGVARGEKMDLIVQKAVELGVKKITPLLMERSTVKLDAEKCLKRQQHWQAIAISACEQSGRNIIPEIALPLSFSEWLRKFQEGGIILSPYSKTKISNLNLSKESAINLLVGPEGGVSEDEVDLLLQRDFISLNLGPRILRTETAPLAVIAALQTKFGDMG